MLLIASVVKLVAEVALMALIGRGALGLLLGSGRDASVFYRVLDTVCRPVLSVARATTPAAVPARLLPWICASVLFSLWLLALALKVSVCLRIGMALCR